MRTFANVSINPDSYALDNQSSVPLPVADSRRVLIVSGHAAAEMPPVIGCCPQLRWAPPHRAMLKPGGSSEF